MSWSWLKRDSYMSLASPSSVEWQALGLNECRSNFFEYYTLRAKSFSFVSDVATNAFSFSRWRSWQLITHRITWHGWHAIAAHRWSIDDRRIKALLVPASSGLFPLEIPRGSPTKSCYPAAPVGTRGQMIDDPSEDFRRNLDTSLLYISILEAQSKKSTNRSCWPQLLNTFFFLAHELLSKEQATGCVLESKWDRIMSESKV